MTNHEFTPNSNHVRTKRIGLGTVQFGMDYGVSNSGGQTTVEEATKIVQSAAESGMRFIDTAASYGESEAVLGEVLPADNQFGIVTKTVAIRSERVGDTECAMLKSTFLNSLKKLKLESVYGLLIHDARDLECDGADNLFETLLELKESGEAHKIGLSVYNEAQIDMALDNYPIDIIQLPLSILDQRLLKSGHLALLRKRGVEIHVRSTFLQGLLLMDPNMLTAQFDTVKKHLDSFHGMLTNSGVTPLEAALDFVLGVDEIDCVITGVESAGQLQEILNAARRTLPVSIDYDQWSWNDPNILDPSNWKVQDQPQEIL